MKKAKELTEELLYNIHILMPINEMAKLTGDIEVHNEDDNNSESDQLKFAHFHYKGVHFKLSRHCPKNASQARKMIAFSKEQKKIDDFELTQLCNILNGKPIKPRKTPYKTVYEQIIDIWETLNDRDADFMD